MLAEEIEINKLSPFLFFSRIQVFMAPNFAFISNYEFRLQVWIGTPFALLSNSFKKSITLSCYSLKTKPLSARRVFIKSNNYPCILPLRKKIK